MGLQAAVRHAFRDSKEFSTASSLTAVSTLLAMVKLARSVFVSLSNYCGQLFRKRK